jgi:hypothetical protein
MKGGGGGSGKVPHQKYTDKIYNSITKGETIGCDKVSFITSLQNLQENFIKYEKGDILNVVYFFNKILVTGTHGDCGYITAPGSSLLIDCLNAGSTFRAVILEIKESSCLVKVYFYS